MSTPNFNTMLGQSWGWGPEPLDMGWLCGFSNLVFGNNPQYTVTEFLQFSPGFGGTPLSITATLSAGSTVLASVPQYASLSVGQLITGTGIPSGTLIVSIGSAAPHDVTMSSAALISGTGLSLSVYTAPLLPLVVMNAYIALASASLVQARWQSTWSLAMYLYVAHYCTLWLRSDGDIYTTPGQKASAGFAMGVAVSKSVGSVSTSMQLPQGLEDWGMWATTSYGMQLATLARVMGSGPSLVF